MARRAARIRAAGAALRNRVNRIVYSTFHVRQVVGQRLKHLVMQRVAQRLVTLTFILFLAWCLYEILKDNLRVVMSPEPLVIEYVKMVKTP
jgi:hypothetical protein